MLGSGRLRSCLRNLGSIGERSECDAVDRTNERADWRMNGECLMDLRQMQFSIAEGGHATLAFRESVTLEAVEMLEEASALMFRTLRRTALRQRARDEGAIEYDSWVKSLSGSQSSTICNRGKPE